MNGSLARVGVLGCGTVGSALISLVHQRSDAVEARTGLRLEIVRVAVRDLDRPRSVTLAPGLLTADAAALVVDPDIDVVVEVMGGLEPARELVLTALAAGKPVVTANKALVAACGSELFAAAEKAGVDLLFEAAVAGGVPVVRPLRESLLGEPVHRVLGIVNGTTNYILTRMSEAGASYADALAEAQSLGYAEADPSADVEGLDAAAKIAIVASIVFGYDVTVDDVNVEGITSLTAEDIAFAARHGLVVKLLAAAERFDEPDGDELVVRVHPTLVPENHPLAAVRESFNAVFVEGGAVGALMFYGRGAGGEPTASAMLGDLIDAAVNRQRGAHASIGALSPPRFRPDDELSSVYHLSIQAADRPGVLAAVASVFGEHRRVHRVDGAGRAVGRPRRGRARRRGANRLHHPPGAGPRPRGDPHRSGRPRRRAPRGQRAPGPLRRRHPVVSGLTYVSTRGAAPELGFADVLLAGLARDGGLYVPSTWPVLEPGALGRYADADYATIATEVMWPFVEGALDHDVFAAMVSDAYAGFDDPDVVPLVELDNGVWLAELFHGPTLAFKDIALQLVGRLFDHELTRRGEKVTVVGATSGDTGSAAIEALRDRETAEVFIFHPAGRVSEVQRRQMTTVDAPNIHNIAVEGTFDDCQDLVKALFADTELRDRRNLSAVNSINWARVMAQIVYYVSSSARLGGGEGRPIAFSVPTGNFGNVFAGYGAQRMGTPVSQFVVASNRNDILTRFLTTGTMTIGEVHPTLSPSMDIQVSSNLERLLFELYGRDGSAIAELMARFRAEGTVTVEAGRLDLLAEHWSAGRVDDEVTRATIAAHHERTGVLLDPHTAVGLAAAIEARADRDVPMVVLSTAHPAKFPDAVEAATGVRPPLPDHLADLFDRPERYEVVANDLETVRRLIETTLEAQ